MRFKMKKETTDKNFSNFAIKIIAKYGVFTIIPIVAIFSMNITLPEKYQIEAADIILVMLPMIFTIITISLSLPSEKIYGISITKFRRLRVGIYFSFLEMILITVLIFTLYTFFKIFNSITLIWALDFIAIVFAILFTIQEIPILVHNNKFIINVVKKAWMSKNKKSMEYGTSAIRTDLHTVIQNIVLQNGIVSTYNALKNEESEDSATLNELLSINNEYFFECADNVEFFSEGIINSYKGINILNAIEISFSNIEDIFNFKDTFNVIKIYNDYQHYYQVTRLIFNLQEITSKLNLKTKFKDKLKQLTTLLFNRINYFNPENREKKFIYSILNSMLTISTSNDALWAIRSIRDANYYSQFLTGAGDAYYYFVSIYVYFICELNKHATNIIKEDLSCFLNEKADDLNSDGSTWLSVMYHNRQFEDINKFISLLPELILIFGENDHFLNWYQPKHCTSWSSSDGCFSKALLFNCWLENIACNSFTYHYKEDTIINTLRQLPDTVQQQFALELNANWFINNEFIDKRETPFLAFYNLKSDLIIDKNDKIAKELKKYKNEVLLKVKKEELAACKKSEEDLKTYKEKLIGEFHSAITQLPIIDDSIPLEKEPDFCYDLLFDIRGIDQIIQNYSARFKNSLISLIYDKLTNTDIPVFTASKSNKQELLKKLKSYSCKIGNIYRLYKLNLNENEYKRINSLQSIELPIPCFLLLNKPSLKINICIKEQESFTRRLTPNEINEMIDRDYKVVDGLYKYSDSDNDISSVFISRDEIYSIILNKYIYARLVFKYKTDIGNDILQIDVAK